MKKEHLEQEVQQLRKWKVQPEMWKVQLKHIPSFYLAASYAVWHL